jgi:hypothetical protein
MNRRKFVLGLGAASVSGSALIGSGAFTSVSAERDIAVSTTGDDDAFLRLGACTNDAGEAMPNGGYVDQGSDGLFSISLSGDNDNNPPAGSGVNQYAVSRFDNVFEVCNQGTQSVCVDFAVDVPVIPNGADVPDRFDFGDGDLAVVFYRGGNPDDPINVDDLNADREGAFPLDVGDCQCVGIEVRAFGFETGEDLFEGAELEIVADADAECSNKTPTNPPDEPGNELEEVYADTVISSDQGTQKNGNEIPSDRSDEDHPVGEENGEFFSLGFKGDESPGGQLVVGFDEELVKRPYATDVLNIETTGGSRDDYPEEKALVEVAGPGTDDEFVELGTATNKASNGVNTFEIPAEPITEVRLTDQTDPSIHNGGADGFDVDAVGGYTEE